MIALSIYNTFFLLGVDVRFDFKEPLTYIIFDKDVLDCVTAYDQC